MALLLHELNPSSPFLAQLLGTGTLLPPNTKRVILLSYRTCMQ